MPSIVLDSVTAQPGEIGGWVDRGKKKIVEKNVDGWKGRGKGWVGEGSEEESRMSVWEKKLYAKALK